MERQKSISVKNVVVNNNFIKTLHSEKADIIV